MQLVLEQEQPTVALSSSVQGSSLEGDNWTLQGVLLCAASQPSSIVCLREEREKLGVECHNTLNIEAVQVDENTKDDQLEPG
jgi:hypothetical protein